MSYLSSELKKQLRSITTAYYLNCMDLHEKIKMEYCSYFIGTGIDIEEDSPQEDSPKERFKNQYLLAVNQLWDFLKPISSLTTPEKNKIYSLTKDNMYDFYLKSNRQEISNFEKKLEEGLQELFPSKSIMLSFFNLGNTAEKPLQTQSPIQQDEIDVKIEAWATGNSEYIGAKN